jgi:site-specific recombinase XerD
MDLIDTLEKYKKSFSNENKFNGLSEKTLKLYVRVIDQFIDYMREFNDDIDIYGINRLYLQNFIMNLDIANSSKNTYIDIMKIFFRHMTANNENSFDFYSILSKIKIKEDKKEPEYLEKDEIIKIDKYAIGKYDKKKNFLSIRNLLIYRFFVYTGMRVNELVNIKYENIQFNSDSDKYIIRIFGKGNKERFSYIKYNTIQPFFDELKNINKTNKGYLFTTSKNRKMSPTETYNLLKNMYSNAGVNKTGCHILRHSFARNLVDKDINLSTIKEVLGHSNISTTMKYAKTNEKNKSKAIDNLYD